ncbi:MAG: DUF6151 family protein [Pseudomonadota bacterium]
MDMPIKCRCGQVSGALEDVSPAVVNRLVCYCHDCQAFAHFLDQEDTVLDEHGGTEIVQMAPSRLRIDHGMDKIACMRLSEKGIYRWYASCCNTPLGNTGDFGMPFVGVIHSFLAEDGDIQKNAAFGKIRGAVHGRFARRDYDPGSMPLSLIARFLGVILKGKFSGEQQRAIFFDASTRSPRVAPTVLDAEENEALMARVTAAA